MILSFIKVNKDKL